MKNFIVSAEEHNTRLDKFLTEKLAAEKAADISRSQIKKMIQAGQVSVNKKIPSVHYFLKAGEIVSLTTTAPKKSPAKKPVVKTKKIKEPKIIADEADFLIIEKPAGLLTHPTDKNETDTLVDWLVKKYPACKKIGPDPRRAGLVHRLDREVSGVMVIPKTQDSFDSLKKQFQNHTIVKKYLALVAGRVQRDEGEINFPISRSQTKSGLFAAKPQNQEGKKAITRFQILEKYQNFTLLSVEILTGRTHQIRVHLLAYGHPVAGDRLYQPKPNTKQNPSRIFLHAAELAFIDLNGQRRHYQSPLPKILKDFLKTLPKSEKLVRIPDKSRPKADRKNS